MADFIKIPDKPALYQAADTDNIKAVIGGQNQDYFAPSANVSFKMQSGVEQYFFNIADDIDQVKTADKVETLVGDKLAIVGGDVESTFTLSETSLKIERVFSTKPTTAPKYTLAFSSGVQFFYQGELTAEEITEGCSRPDNVVGSYAVYCGKQGHYKNPDGTTKVNYGCGKIGHLYAPYWTDSSGKKIKGTQEIVGNLLTFALPDQEWIDSAVLPITLDPDIGYTTVGGSTMDFENVGISNTKDGAGSFLTTDSSGGTLDSVSVWLSSGWSRSIDVGVYDKDASDSPDNLIDNQTKSSSFVTGWNSIDMPDSQKLDASTAYFPALAGGSGSGSAAYDNSSSGLMWYAYSISTLPDPNTWTQSYGRLYSLYFTVSNSSILPTNLTGTPGTNQIVWTWDGPI